MIAPPPDDLWALELAKARQAAGPDAPSGGGFWPAAVLGLAAWVRTILTTPAGDPLPDAPLVAALHGEIANRTRHLIAALAAEAPDTPILLLGRPQLDRAALRQGLTDAGLTGPLIRPFDLASALGALPAILRRLGEGARFVAAADWRPAPRDLAAICFRVMLGETHARWAASHVPAGPRTVVFGHTGVADSHLLERALQRCGARTVHWVHGVSLGLNFVAGSDLGLFQCGSDARWHESLGGYGSTASLPATAPTPATGGDGWLVLSNLVHPMNADYRRHGLAGEVALLEAVAAAAGPARRVWKPHPILERLDNETRQTITARAAALGFERWADDAPLDTARAFAVVVSTPSTVVLDVLKLGVLPTLYGGGGLDPDSAIAQLPLRADDAAGLGAAAERLKTADFAAAWTAIGPGRAPTLADILSLVRP
jgi:hypothetical protein